MGPGREGLGRWPGAPGFGQAWIESGNGGTAKAWRGSWKKPPRGMRALQSRGDKGCDWPALMVGPSSRSGLRSR